MSEHEEFKTVLTDENLIDVKESIGEAFIAEKDLVVEIPSQVEAPEVSPPSQSETNTFFPEEPVVQQEEEPVVQQEEEPVVQQEEEPVVQQEEEPVVQQEEEEEDNVSSLTDEVENAEMIPMLSNEEEVNDITDDVKTLAKLVELILLSQENNEKYQISISPEVQSILAKLMDHATCLDEVEKSLKEIIKDDKINANDVPQIMLLLTSIYDVVKDFKMSSITTKNCGDVLKVLVDIAIKEKLIVINDDTAIIIECLSNIIDSSILLMQLKDAMPEVRGILKCIKELFRRN
jgi:hypothetical protein